MARISQPWFFSRPSREFLEGMGFPASSQDPKCQEGEVKGAQSSVGESPQGTLPRALGTAFLPQAASPCSEPATLLS